MSLKNICWAALLLSGAALAQERGFVGGKIVFADAMDRLTPRQAQQVLGGEEITLEIRSGDLVLDAKLDADGHFLVEAPPGRYRLEYIGVGDAAEFVPAQELDVAAGTLTCAGTLEVDTEGIDLLGSNTRSHVRVADECEEVMPRLRKLARAPREERNLLARAGPRVEHDFALDPLDHLNEARVEGYVSDIGWVGRVRYMHLFSPFGQYVLPLLYVAGSTGAYYTPDLADAYGAYDLVGGGGLRLLNISLVGFGGTRLSRAAAVPALPVAGGLAHLDAGWWGVGVRYEVLPIPGWALTVDVAPFALLGDLL